MCPRGRGVHDPLGQTGLGDFAFVISYQADIAVLTLEGNCHFKPLKQKLGRLKRHCNDMSTLMAALVKYADSDNTKDPDSEEDKPEKGKKNGNAKGRQHNPAGHGNAGKRKADSSLDFVANTNA